MLVCVYWCVCWCSAGPACVLSWARHVCMSVYVCMYVCMYVCILVLYRFCLLCYLGHGTCACLTLEYTHVCTHIQARTRDTVSSSSHVLTRMPAPQISAQFAACMRAHTHTHTHTHTHPAGESRQWNDCKARWHARRHPHPPPPLHCSCPLIAFQAAAVSNFTSLYFIVFYFISDTVAVFSAPTRSLRVRAASRLNP